MIPARSRQIGPVEVQKPKARDRAAASASAFASRRTSCPNGRGAPRASMPFARSLSARDFRRRFPGGPRRPARQGSAQPFRSGDRAPQEQIRTNIDDGRSAICRRAITSTSGRTSITGADGAAGQLHAGADGRDARGLKELIGFQTGMRESGQNWKELLVDLKARGLVVAPQAVAMARLEFWRALDEARRRVISDAGCTRH